MSDVTPEQAKELLEKDGQYVYLDVRTVPEFEAGHVPGSWNIPVVKRNGDGGMAQNPAFMPEVESRFGKNQHLIVGCKSGGRSAMAVRMLREAGYPNARNMVGGFYGRDRQAGWTQLGYPTHHGEVGKQKCQVRGMDSD